MHNKFGTETRFRAESDRQARCHVIFSIEAIAEAFSIFAIWSTDEHSRSGHCCVVGSPRWTPNGKLEIHENIKRLRSCQNHGQGVKTRVSALFSNPTFFPPPCAVIIEESVLSKARGIYKSKCRLAVMWRSLAKPPDPLQPLGYI